MRPYLTAHTPADARRYYAAGNWKADTLIGILARHAREQPDLPALTDPDLRFTWAEMLMAVQRVAGWLVERDIADGEPMMVQMRNCSMFAITNVAASAVGAPLILVPVSARSQELGRIAERVQARFFITDAARRGPVDFDATMAERGVNVFGDKELVIRATATTTPTWRVEDAIGDADRILDLMFTSGTTGLPKGILNTTNSKLSGLRPFLDVYALDRTYPWLVLPPMSHNGGWLYSYLAALVSGAHAVFQERFEPATTLALIREHEIAAVFFTPTHCRDVLAHVRESGVAAISTLRYVFVGAAHTPVELKRAAMNQLGVEPISLYGSTENQAVTLARPGRRVEDLDESVGSVCPGMELAAFGGADRRTRLTAGEIGEIGSRGPGLFAGYYDDQLATNQSFNRDGWFFAGDVGYVDETGNLHLRGRSKELIIRGGRNIAPDDVEAALGTHPDIAAVCAVSLPDERLGERVCAVIISRRPTLKLADLVSHVTAGGHSAALRPEAMFVVDRFEYTDTGKVRRLLLQQLAVQALADGRVEIVNEG